MRIGITLRTMLNRNGWLALTIAAVMVGSTAQADVKLPNVFGDHMVLQQGQRNKIWGLADRVKPSTSRSTDKVRRQLPPQTARGMSSLTRFRSVALMR